MNKMKIQYKIYNPSGNITALVIGDQYHLEEKKIINQKIMDNNLKVEQVGFLSTHQKKLTMAGGEFCGNATRCAILYYGMQKGESLIINNYRVLGGIDQQNVWCEIPIHNYSFCILKQDIYKVKLDNITLLVVTKRKTRNLKEEAVKLICLNKIEDEAVGVVFLEKQKILKIYPVIWVKNIGTLFLESACGTGTIAIGMLESILSNRSGFYKIMQPSGKILETKIIIKKGKIIRAILKGEIQEEESIKELIINI